jgi:hypothetical protein
MAATHVARFACIIVALNQSFVLSSKLRRAEFLTSSHAVRYEQSLSGLIQDDGKSRLPDSSIEFLKSFRVCAKCNHWERLGAWNDGGYETCMDEFDGKSGIKAAMSMGVREEDEWSVDVNRRWHVPVYQFDCTVKSAQKCPDCHFFEKCIKSEDGSGDSFPGRSWTLSEVFKKTNLSSVPDRSIFLKIDIESSEWWVFEKEDPAILRKFRQIAVEFHVLRVVEEHERKLRAMRKLQDAGFVVAHLHGNNWAPFVEVGAYSFPDVVEAILVSDPKLKGQCDNHPGDFPGDSPNNPIGPKYPHATLPAML